MSLFFIIVFGNDKHFLRHCYDWDCHPSPYLAVTDNELRLGLLQCRTRFRFYSRFTVHTFSSTKYGLISILHLFLDFTPLFKMAFVMLVFFYFHLHSKNKCFTNGVYNIVSSLNRFMPAVTKIYLTCSFFAFKIVLYLYFT